MMKISMPGGLFITCMVNLWLVKKGTKRNVGDMSIFIFNKYLFYKSYNSVFYNI